MTTPIPGTMNVHDQDLIHQTLCMRVEAVKPTCPIPPVDPRISQLVDMFTIMDERGRRSIMSMAYTQVSLCMGGF